MKNLTKIFMAVAIAMFAFSCVTDTTDDAAVKVGGKTTLAISLGGGNRTTLGEAADGVYPVTWAEGDQITVNGVTSDELTSTDGAGTANAVFTFNAELAAPYCVAYPAAEAGQVVFAAEQEYVDGTFANGAATMYGYARNGNITLNHLTGVLKIGVVCGEDVDFMYAPVIQSVKISTIDRAPIAGAFNIDFTTGAVTATDDAVSVINYSINERLSTDPTYLHIAVPAGVYNELYVTLEDSNGGVMYATVTAGDNEPLVAGKVREFATPIVYQASEDGTFVINDSSSLFAFKNAVEAGAVSNAVFSGDVDMTNVEWTSIEAANYTGTIYGNGFAIKGLKAPLFNVTAASFKGLHLDVNIEETENPNTGGFARRIVANGNAPVVMGCSASGSITVVSDAVPASEDVINNGATGGITGVASGVSFKDCTNNVTIEIDQLSTTKKMIASVGGIVGFTDKANSLFTQFENCTNNGSITYSDTTGKVAAYMSGIVATYRGANSVATLKNCCNNGDITTAEGATVRSCRIGGIIAYSNGTSSAPKTFYFEGNTVNTGNITLNTTHTGNANIGAILGAMDSAITIDFKGPVTNSGSLTVNGSGTNLNLSCCIARFNSGCTVTFYGDVTNTETADIVVSGSFSGICYLTGIVATATHEYDNLTYPNLYLRCKNIVHNGDITMSGSCGDTCRLAGIGGYTFNTPVKIGNNCRFVNNGNFTVTKSATLKDLDIGGAFGRRNGYDFSVFEGESGQVINHGNIKVEGKVSGTYRVGGLFGHSFAGLGNYDIKWVNTGNIEAYAEYAEDQTVLVGGIAGHIGSSDQKRRAVRRAQCYCDIKAYYVDKDGNDVPYPLVGMLVGDPAGVFGECTDVKLGGSIATSSTNTVVLNEENVLTYTAGDGVVDTADFKSVSWLSSVNNIDYGSYGK